MHRRFLKLATCLVTVALLSSSCSVLKDAEPFTVSITYDDSTGTFQLVGPDPTQPTVIDGDSAFGEVQIENATGKEHGFAIDDLAVFETVAAGRTKTVSIQEAKDDHTYTFYCHKHKNEFIGSLRINYVVEGER